MGQHFARCDLTDSNLLEVDGFVFCLVFLLASNGKVEKFTCKIIYLDTLRELEILVPGAF